MTYITNWKMIKYDKNDRKWSKMTKMTEWQNDKNDKIFFSKKEYCPKKNFTKKSIKNYQKLNKEQYGDRQTDRQTDRHSDS